MTDEKLFGKERVNMFIQDFFGIRFNVTLHILHRKIDIARNTRYKIIIANLL